MGTDPRLLLGIIVVLGLVAVGLVVWLIQYFLRGEDSKGDAVASASSLPPEVPLSEASSLSTDDVSEQQRASELQRPSKHQGAPEPQRRSPPSPQPVNSDPETVSRLDVSAEPETGLPRPPASQPGDKLLMQIFQDRQGMLVIEVGGRRYHHLFEIKDGRIGRQVIDIINRLVAFSKGQQPEVMPAAPDESLSSEPPSTPINIARSPGLPGMFRSEPETKPKPSRITTDPIPFRRRSEAEELSITLNLAEEIDQLLQMSLESLPEYSQYHIHVRNAPDGGLRFEVEGVRYASLDEIPDGQVQALIRSVIAEWEARR